MDTRKIAAEYRLAHWANIMRERQESGQSTKTYCESAGIHPNTYYYWQRKLRTVASQKLATMTPTEASGIDKFLVPKGWAVCEATKTASNEKPLTIEIGDCRVLANADVDSELLLKVCRVLVIL
jgi:transposase-like protein